MDGLWATLLLAAEALAETQWRARRRRVVRLAWAAGALLALAIVGIEAWLLLNLRSHP